MVSWHKSVVRSGHLVPTFCVGSVRTIMTEIAKRIAGHDFNKGKVDMVRHTTIACAVRTRSLDGNAG